jgi:hypothetical protein
MVNIRENVYSVAKSSSLSACRAVNQLARHVLLLVRRAAEFPQEVREKEHLQDGKHDEQLDEDNHPQRFADGHAPKALHVKAEYAYRYRIFAHIVHVEYVIVAYAVLCFLPIAANPAANMGNFIGITENFTVCFLLTPLEICNNWLSLI